MGGKANFNRAVDRPSGVRKTGYAEMLPVVLKLPIGEIAMRPVRKRVCTDLVHRTHNQCIVESVGNVVVEDFVEVGRKISRLPVFRPAGTLRAPANPPLNAVASGMNTPTPKPLSSSSAAQCSVA